MAARLSRSRARQSRVGVDVEIPVPKILRISDKFLSKAEHQLFTIPFSDKTPGHAVSENQLPTLLWSAKEAALKVLRVGLRADTRSVEVTLDLQARPDGWAALSIAASSGEAFPGWWRRDGVYLLTLAARVPHQPPARLDGGSDLAHGIPTHSWIGRPLVQ